MTAFPIEKSKWFIGDGTVWMKEIDTILNRIDYNADGYKEYLMTRFGVSTSTSPIDVFTHMQFDSHTVSDLLRALLIYWENQELPDSEQQFYRMRQGLLMQVTTLCRYKYIEFLSKVEFGVTQAIKELPDLFEPPRKKQKIYLGKVIEKSAALGWISTEHQKAWEGLIELRNTLVHRNGISDKTASYKITEAHILDFEEGKSFGGHINGMAKLCEWAQEATFIWSKSYFEVLVKKTAK